MGPKTILGTQSVCLFVSMYSLTGDLIKSQSVDSEVKWCLSSTLNNALAS